ncbi:circularly permuted type 2 ATP-grasp protein [Paenibacillus radicis (ex Xue et al. 2023)]|uniref:Circularly permuted type 2 ATP-grasp protein n=1 Tax=Paenibacillus radicis (ex Xue et al. 2023) TaxID=2972489 RepID=A0ABT1YSA2_9BACL|nr:circularly permuted type 2 ATP-grasp protein [Paenibacillus radicis (ex Xue et al. 2023)]MCR8636062.1 circularly permuted type 2 ATP-grasp protein [Paenibacillus radicis (ex Xue et al. 2023)]
MAMINRSHNTPYPLESFYDEMFMQDLLVRPHYQQAHSCFSKMKGEELAAKQKAMNRRMLEEGITFTLYQPEQSQPLERTIPFDMIPRVIPGDEWAMLERGLLQRVKALNQFLHDMYHKQNMIAEGLIPRKMIVGNRYFRPEMMHIDVPGGVYMATSGIDLIRDADGRYYVLEDNLRSPSGFSYLFKGRSIMNQLFPELTFSSSIRDVEHSLNHFLSSLRSLSPSRKSEPVIALLTPGEFNSAYYEHAFLAQQMGIHLVEGRDLVAIDHKIYIRNMKGLQQVDVLYSRIDDDFLDPLAFRPDSMLGVAGIMNAYRAGNIAIANAPGTGIADDKAIYAYVPDMIRYYLNEEPILNNVPTYLLSRPDEREYVLERLHTMVVKETSLSGGYGMLIGPAATEQEIEAFAEQIKLDPERYIAQPTMQLSRAPVMLDGRMVPRHIDLRAFVLMGNGNTHIIPGGLTRVALKEGSLVVNSSQGGGCKDTWVLA